MRNPFYSFILNALVERVGCHEAVRHAQLLLVCLDVCDVHITDDVVVLLRCVLLANMREAKQVALLLGLIAEVDAEGVVARVVGNTESLRFLYS